MTHDVEVIRPQAGKQELALGLEADVIFLAGSLGSAKSYTLMMRMLNHIEDPDFRSIYFRRTTKQLEGQGGLWDEAKDLYGKFGAKFVGDGLMATFPSGAKAQFGHLQHEKHKIDHQGLICSPFMQ